MSETKSLIYPWVSDMYIRHVFTSFVVVDKPADPQLYQDIAYKMDTSIKVMIHNYADFKFPKYGQTNAPLQL